ncbi:MAG: hypothetical protein MJ078_03095 [Clostridia bacterium]|nr:hypothetical protein [Clostridia bacterium]
MVAVGCSAFRFFGRAPLCGRREGGAFYFGKSSVAEEKKLLGDPRFFTGAGIGRVAAISAVEFSLFDLAFVADRRILRYVLGKRKTCPAFRILPTGRKLFGDLLAAPVFLQLFPVSFSATGG